MEQRGIEAVKRRRHNHKRVKVYHRTLEHIGVEMEHQMEHVGVEILYPNDLRTLCRECYKELHDHGDCSGPKNGGGCFHEEIGPTIG
jgi:hypothetical protein